MDTKSSSGTVGVRPRRLQLHRSRLPEFTRDVPITAPLPNTLSPRTKARRELARKKRRGVNGITCIPFPNTTTPGVPLSPAKAFDENLALAEEIVAKETAAAAAATAGLLGHRQPSRSPSMVSSSASVAKSSSVPAATSAPTSPTDTVPTGPSPSIVMPSSRSTKSRRSVASHSKHGDQDELTAEPSAIPSTPKSTSSSAARPPSPNPTTDQNEGEKVSALLDLLKWHSNRRLSKFLCGEFMITNRDNVENLLNKQTARGGAAAAPHETSMTSAASSSQNSSTADWRNVDNTVERARLLTELQALERDCRRQQLRSVADSFDDHRRKMIQDQRNEIRKRRLEIFDEKAAQKAHQRELSQEIRRGTNRLLDRPRSAPLAGRPHSDQQHSSALTADEPVVVSPTSVATPKTIVNRPSSTGTLVRSEAEDALRALYRSALAQRSRKRTQPEVVKAKNLNLNIGSSSEEAQLHSQLSLSTVLVQREQRIAGLVQAAASPTSATVHRIIASTHPHPTSALTTTTITTTIGNEEQNEDDTMKIKAQHGGDFVVKEGKMRAVILRSSAPASTTAMGPATPNAPGAPSSVSWFGPATVTITSYRSKASPYAVRRRQLRRLLDDERDRKAQMKELREDPNKWQPIPFAKPRGLLENKPSKLVSPQWRFLTQDKNKST